MVAPVPSVMVPAPTVRVEVITLTCWPPLQVVEFRLVMSAIEFEKTVRPVVPELDSVSVVHSRSDPVSLTVSLVGTPADMDTFSKPQLSLAPVILTEMLASAVTLVAEMLPDTTRSEPLVITMGWAASLAFRLDRKALEPPAMLRPTNVHTATVVTPDVKVEPLLIMRPLPQVPADSDANLTIDPSISTPLPGQLAALTAAAVKTDETGLSPLEDPETVQLPSTWTVESSMRHA